MQCSNFFAALPFYGQSSVPLDTRKRTSMGLNSFYFFYSYYSLFLKVTQRLVRDRYNLLVKKQKLKRGAEDKASGIATNHNEIDEALRDLFGELMKLILQDRKQQLKKSKVDEELVQAQDMRSASLETFGEPRKKKQNDKGEDSQKRS